MCYYRQLDTLILTKTVHGLRAGRRRYRFAARPGVFEASAAGQLHRLVCGQLFSPFLVHFCVKGRKDGSPSRPLCHFPVCVSPAASFGSGRRHQGKGPSGSLWSGLCGRDHGDVLQLVLGQQPQRRAPPKRPRPHNIK